ncbi:hypothetical protein GCM10007924_01780 [Sneathiella chinensis]|uniref:Uncharacterized protein n=1 Tax=Sneathiella chinensis TaxID=349750 RepID=A0ABQ5TYQ3_9PROT|nr:hypothetical protein [Sneathiella chinensis]GLQ04957.1 hypothetical protein GCM10007924_01780 [Sneathiella chinensis]
MPITIIWRNWDICPDGSERPEFTFFKAVNGAKPGKGQQGKLLPAFGGDTTKRINRDRDIPKQEACPHRPQGPGTRMTSGWEQGGEKGRIRTDPGGQMKTSS